MGYGILAYFLQQQSVSSVFNRNIVMQERDFKNLNNLFQETRFWEKVLLSQASPEANMQFGSLVEETRELLAKISKQDLDSATQSTITLVIKDINQYETNFNKLIQLKFKQSLLSTRLETKYSSLVSIILSSNNPTLLKPLFSLTHFMKVYNNSKDVSKHQAIKLVIGSIFNKFNKIGSSAVQMQGYLENFNTLLDKDYEMELTIVATNKTVESINTQLKNNFIKLTLDAETRFNKHYQETSKLRRELQTIFLVFAILGVVLLLIVLYIFSKNIVTPIRSISSAMNEIKNGNMEARFHTASRKSDEIIQLGLTFNEMLEALHDNNLKLVNYQKDLEKNIVEISERETERKKLTNQLHIAEKMQAIGTMAAGVAHEINTPIQFIGDNTLFVKDSLEDLLNLILQYKEILIKYQSCAEIDLTKQISIIDEDADLEFLTEEIPKALEQTNDGVKHVANIVRAMKDFSHINIDEKKQQEDIIQAIKTTLVITKNVWHFVADVEEHHDTTLPLAYCFIGEIKQVLLNLVVNAAQAIVAFQDETGDSTKGIITITTSYDDKNIQVAIADSGSGIDDSNKDKIFDPFFTTKEVGEGTGQGLSMVYQIIVDKNGGDIWFESEKGVGTTFYFTLPHGES